MNKDTLRCNTPKQRLIIYRRALKIIKKETPISDNGLCSLMSFTVGVYIYSPRSDDNNENDKVFKEKLPELYAQKPNEMYDDLYWWESGYWPPRVRALEAAIKMIEM
jgi:hypothetical protein